MADEKSTVIKSRVYVICCRVPLSRYSSSIHKSFPTTIVEFALYQVPQYLGKNLNYMLGLLAHQGRARAGAVILMTPTHNRSRQILKILKYSHCCGFFFVGPTWFCPLLERNCLATISCNGFGLCVFVFISVETGFFARPRVPMDGMTNCAELCGEKWFLLVRENSVCARAHWELINNEPAPVACLLRRLCIVPVLHAYVCVYAGRQIH